MPSSGQPNPRRPERRCPVVRTVRDRLIRRGLRPRLAVRYARQLQEHWEDLRDERLAAGAPPDEAEAEADRRLGGADELVAAAVKAHRAESFGGRHPLLGFVLLPLLAVPLFPLVVVLAVLVPLSEPWSDDAEEEVIAGGQPPARANERAMVYAYWSLHAWTFAVPAAVAVFFHRRARRRTLSAAWAWAAAATAAVSGAMQHLHLAPPRGGRDASLVVHYGGWPDPSALCFTIACTALVVWLARRRHEARPPPAV